MKHNDLILSYLYLHCILPNLEEIIEFDKDAKEITKNWNCSVQFDVSGGPKVALLFKDGKMQVKREKIFLPSVGMWFPSSPSANKMFEGKFALPLIWMGFWRIGLLKNFISLTKKIELYLRANPALLKNEEIFKFNLKLKFYTLLWGIKTIADNENSFKVKRAKAVISRFSGSVFQVEILPDGPYGFITIQEGKLTPHKGKHPSPTSILKIKDMSVAKKMFDEELDFSIALGCQDIRLVGHIQLGEAISILMEELSEYLPK